MVVEISLGAMNAVFDGEQMGDGLFGGGLAHGAGNTDRRFAPQLSDGGGESLEGDESVVNGEQVFGIRGSGLADLCG